MVGIIDYGMGNLLSVFHAVEHLGFPAGFCRKPEELAGCERLILPGVGAFRDCMNNLHDRRLVEPLNEAVLSRHVPILGICLGMQAMARRSFEGGEHAGLGWFAAEVVRLQPAEPALRVPHMGWNSLGRRAAHPLFAGVPADADFYFVHSFHLRCEKADEVIATCEHGGPVTAVVARANIFATQFHPEKSQTHGLRLLENFLTWKP